MKTTTIRVLTYNIKHGSTMKGDFDLDRIAHVIVGANPDIVALQEVDVKTGRARGMDIAAEIASRTEMKVAFGKALDFDGGGYGVAILARHGLDAPRCEALPNTGGNEQRAALAARVTLPGGVSIPFVSTHLEVASEADRVEQAQRINALFTQDDEPALLAGDFNAQPASETLAVLEAAWTPSDGEDAEPTFPSDTPKIKIDYVFYRPAHRWKVVETRVIQDAVASDHCAFLAVLDLRPA